MRFPRITHYRPDRGTKDIATIEDIEREWKRMMKGMSHWAKLIWILEIIYLLDLI